MDGKNSPKVNIGTASIVVVFSVLCLTVFAVLSLITANSEKRLADKSARAVSDYYAADLICSEKVCALQNALQNGEDAENAAETLGADISRAGESLEVSFSEKIDENQELFVRLSVSDETLNILTWQARDCSVWEADDTIAVWDGN